MNVPEYVYLIRVVSFYIITLEGHTYFSEAATAHNILKLLFGSPFEY